jgi:succinate dehydrogenase/fumarate reductase-like Fe-S protein
MDHVSIEFMGKTYRVSKDATLLSALLEVGWDSVRGLGCLGGCCGACAALYRLPGESHVRTGLACCLPVQDGISFALVRHAHPPKPLYHLSSVTEPQQALFDLFKEVASCRNCGACTQACPQGIDVRTGIWAAVFGDFKTTADLFQCCVQCGFCVRVCSAGLRPYQVAVYARRSLGALLTERPPELDTRIEQIQSGQYAAQWAAVLQDVQSSPAERGETLPE